MHQQLLLGGGALLVCGGRSGSSVSLSNVTLSSNTLVVRGFLHSPVVGGGGVFVAIRAPSGTQEDPILGASISLAQVSAGGNVVLSDGAQASMPPRIAPAPPPRTRHADPVKTMG